MSSLRELFQKAGKVVVDAIPDNSPLLPKNVAAYEKPIFDPKSPKSAVEQFEENYPGQTLDPRAGLQKGVEAVSQVGANLLNRLVSGEVKQDATASDVGRNIAKKAGASAETQEVAGSVASAVPSIVSMAMSRKAPTQMSAVQVKPDMGYGKTIITGAPGVQEQFKKASSASIQAAANLAKDIKDPKTIELVKVGISSSATPEEKVAAIKAAIERSPEHGRKIQRLMMNYMDAKKLVKQP